MLECYSNLVAVDAEPYLLELLEILFVRLAHSSHVPLLESMADACLVIMSKLRQQAKYGEKHAATASQVAKID